MPCKKYDQAIAGVLARAEDKIFYGLSQLILIRVQELGDFEPKGRELVRYRISVVHSIGEVWPA
jgi:hypothetical protein